MKSFQIKTRVNFGDNALDRLAEVPYKDILDRYRPIYGEKQKSEPDSRSNQKSR